MALPNLSGFMPYMNMSYVNDANSQSAQEFLNRLQQYDPSARYVDNSTAENPNGGWQLQYDVTKLPKNKLGQNGTMGITEIGKDWAGELYNPKATYDDPTYGKITNTKNVIDKGTWLDWAGPLAVSLITAGLAGPTAFANLGGAGKFASSIPNLARMFSTGQFNPMSLVSSLGGSFLPPQLSQIMNIGSAGIGAYNAIQNRNPISGLSNLYRLGSGLNITGGG